MDAVEPGGEGGGQPHVEVGGGDAGVVGVAVGWRRGPPELIGERGPSAIGECEQLVGDRRAGAGAAGDDERRRDGLVCELGKAPFEIHDAQAVLEQTQDLVPGAPAAHQMEVGFVLERCAQHGEALAMAVAAQVVEARDRHGLGLQAVGVEARTGRFVDGPAFAGEDVANPRRAHAWLPHRRRVTHRRSASLDE